MSSPPRAALAALAGLLAGAAVPARAAPLLDHHLGGVGFGGPTSPDPSAVFWNPAALGAMSGTQLALEASGRLDLYGIDRAPISSATGMPTPGGDRTFRPLDLDVVTPGALTGIVSDLRTEKWRLGLATYTPFAVRFPAAPELRYHADGGTLYAGFTTLSVAARASRNFSAGLGVSLVWPHVDLRFARDRGLEACPAAPCAVEDPALAENYRLHSPFFRWPGATYAFHFGLLLRVPRLRRLTVGASYMTATTLYPHADIRRDVDVEVERAGDDPLAAEGDGRITFGLPQLAHLGARYDLVEGLDLVADVHYVGYRWTDPDTFRTWDLRLSGAELQAGDVPEWIPRYRRFDDVVQLDVGADWTANQRLRLAGRLHLEPWSALPEAQVAADQVEAPSAGLGAGASIRLSTHVTLQAGYAFDAYLPRSVEDSAFSPQARLDCEASGHDLDACVPVAEGRAIPTAAGDYTRFTHTATAGLSLTWW